MFEPDPEQEKKKETFFNTNKSKNNSLNASKNSSGISDLNRQFLERSSQGNFLKLNSTSSSSNRNNNTIGSVFGNEDKSVPSQTASMFSNAFSNTLQQIPNTYSNLTNPFGIANNSSTEGNDAESKRTSTFSNVFGINQNPLSSSKLSQPKSQININKYQLSACVSNFETKLAGAQEVILFKIDLYSNISKNEWSVFHDYNSFYKLNAIFVKFYAKAPYFPGQSFTRLTNLTELIHQKEALNIYIKEVVNRPDLLTSPYAIHFLKLENHYHDINLYKPLDMYDLKDELDLPISCAYFHEQTNLLFLGMGKPKSSLMGGILNRVKGFSFFKSSAPSQVICGQLVVYNIIKNYQGLTHFEPLYSKPLYSECVAMNYYREKNCLVLGLNNGTVALFKVYITESTEESGGEFIIEAGSLSCHKGPIVGAIVDFQYGYIYTMAREVSIKISELNYQKLMREFVITKRNMTVMKYDSDYGRIIIGDEGGSIYVVDIQATPLTPKVMRVISCGIGYISCIYFNPSENIMFVGFKEGNVSIYKIMHYAENKGLGSMIDFSKIKEISFGNKTSVNDIVITHKNEMLFAMANGSIYVYTDDCNNPECKILF